jgi:hypothetical protein
MSWKRYYFPLRDCACGRCPDCRQRQPIEQRRREQIAETGGMPFSFVGSSLSGKGHSAAEAIEGAVLAKEAA